MKRIALSDINHRARLRVRACFTETIKPWARSAIQVFSPVRLIHQPRRARVRAAFRAAAERPREPFVRAAWRALADRLAPGAASRRGARLPRQRFSGGGSFAFALQSAFNGFRSASRFLALSTLARLIGTFGAAPRCFGNRAFLGRRQIDTRTTRLGQTYGNRLFCRSRPVFTFPDVVYFFTHEFTCLGAGRFPFSLGGFCSLNSLLFRHN